MNLLRLLGLQKKEEPAPYPDKDILHLWEDDYLMIELLPAENLEFVICETRRISGFAAQHAGDNGFSDITPVTEAAVATIEKQIALNEAEAIMMRAGLKKVPVFNMQGVGLLEGMKAPLGFGNSTFAVMCERKDDLLDHIWITGKASNDEDEQKLITGIHLLSQAYNFIGVNWYQCKYAKLNEREAAEAFVKSII